MTFSQLKGGFSDDGKLVMFQHKVISPSYPEAMRPGYDITKVDGTMVEGIGEQAYEIPNIKTSMRKSRFSCSCRSMAFCNQLHTCISA